MITPPNYKPQVNSAISQSHLINKSITQKIAFVTNIRQSARNSITPITYQPPPCTQPHCRRRSSSAMASFSLCRSNLPATQARSALVPSSGPHPCATSNLPPAFLPPSRAVIGVFFPIHRRSRSLFQICHQSVFNAVATSSLYRRRCCFSKGFESAQPSRAPPATPSAPVSFSPVDKPCRNLRKLFSDQHFRRHRSSLAVAPLVFHEPMLFSVLH
ncbi:hypothetical protein M0R45_031509 [Rubus argutus]|uniref:Uncharacterized protein n=1 Tax=Rubus argutus TaxID=59490 RepID=A0AAW1WDS9_RUBAR